jgi:2-polyprenyl-3-methyl-5-hydroxy-6-metoxy-1,4-benzoquinol methylase
LSRLMQRMSPSGSEGVSLDCPLCGQRALRELVAKEFQHQRLCRCDGCGLVRLVAGSALRRDYWEDDAVALNVYSNDEVRAEMRQRHERYLPVIAQLRGRTGALLDVGCGIGNFLVAARDAGWKVAGLEVSEKAAAIARSRGFDVETGRLEESRWPSGTFDAVTLWDVVQHLEAPAVAMRIVHEKLKPGGVVFFETPDEDFWARSVARAIYAISQGRIDLLRYFYIPGHKSYFTATTLGRLLEQAGFRTMGMWRDVTAPAKAHRKIAAWRLPARGLVLPLLPSVLAALRRLGVGNKLMLAATRG